MTTYMPHTREMSGTAHDSWMQRPDALLPDLVARYAGPCAGQGNQLASGLTHTNAVVGRFTAIAPKTCGGMT